MAGIVTKQKSVKTEAKTAVPLVFKSLESSADEKGATVEEYATKVEEEREDTNSGRKMGKFREEFKEVAQIMSEPESEKSDNVFIWRIEDDPPVATDGRGPLWLTRLATSWSARFLTAMARRSPLNGISAVRSESGAVMLNMMVGEEVGGKMIEVKNDVYKENENSTEVIKDTRDEILEILNCVSQFENKSQEETVSNDEDMPMTNHSTVPVKIPKRVTEKVDDEKSEVTCEEVPKYEFEEDCDKKSVEVFFNESVMEAGGRVSGSLQGRG